MDRARPLYPVIFLVFIFYSIFPTRVGAAVPQFAMTASHASESAISESFSRRRQPTFTLRGLYSWCSANYPPYLRDACSHNSKNARLLVCISLQLPVHLMERVRIPPASSAVYLSRSSLAGKPAARVRAPRVRSRAAC
jgi:hypothetical protein